MSQAAADIPFFMPEGESVTHAPPPKKKGVQSVSMTLNLTSMIDVVFQLLIYFVVTVSFAMGEGVITAKMPVGDGTSSPVGPPPKELTIILAPRGTYEVSIGIKDIGEAPANFDQLHELLVKLQFDPERARNGMYKPDSPVKIQPSGEVRWQHVVNAFNAAIRARYENVAFSRPSNEG